MYIAFKDNVVGKVEKGEVVEVYDRSSSLKSIYDGTAEKIDSSFMGECPESSRMALLLCNKGSCRVSHIVGGETKENLDPEKKATEIESKIKPDKPNAY